MVLGCGCSWWWGFRLWGVGGSGVSAYIAQVDRLLGAGQGLFPQGGPGVGVLNAGGGGVPAAPPGASGLSFGAGGAAQDYRGSWAQVTGLDDDVNGTAGAGDATGQNGRAGATGVRQTAQSAAAAIAPATGSPAGVKVLVSTMDERMADMQRQIDTTKAQNKLLAGRLRQMVMAYRSAGAGGPGAALGAARGAMGGGMGGMPSMGGFGGGGGGIPGMSALSGLPASLAGLRGSGGSRRKKLLRRSSRKLADGATRNVRRSRFCRPRCKKAV
jgi:peptidoglycan DL-endopeptidase CwlO